MAKFAHLATQSQLAEMLKVSTTTINNWIARRDSTDFPLEKKQVGRYKFYDIEEVQDWHELWVMATKNLGSPNIKKYSPHYKEQT